MGMFEYQCLMPSLRQFAHLAKIVIVIQIVDSSSHPPPRNPGSTNARPRPLPWKCTLSIAPNAPTICKLRNSAIAHLPNSAQDAVRSLTDARRAPSVIDSNFAHTIGGTPQNGPATVPNPQSVP